MTDERTYRRMDGQTDGRTDGRTQGETLYLPTLPGGDIVEAKLPQQDGCRTRIDIKNCTTKQKPAPSPPTHTQTVVRATTNNKLTTTESPH